VEEDLEAREDVTVVMMTMTALILKTGLLAEKEGAQFVADDFGNSTDPNTSGLSVQNPNSGRRDGPAGGMVEDLLRRAARSVEIASV